MRYIVLLGFSCWLLWLSCCSTIVHSHAVGGMLGRSCVLPMTVACAVDLSVEDCYQLQTSATYINKVAGMELVHWTENDTADVLVTYAPDVKAFDPLKSVGADGMRTYFHNTKNGCLIRRFVVVHYLENGFSAASRQSQFRHELLHGLGLAHNTWEPMSVMSPGLAYNLDAPLELTDADLTALHAIYTTGVL